MSKDTAEVANDKPVPSRREGALRQARQQSQKSLKRQSPKEKDNSSPKSADEHDQREAWLTRKYYTYVSLMKARSSLTMVERTENTRPSKGTV